MESRCEKGMAFTGEHTHCLYFFFNDTATTEIYTLSLHDALPISHREPRRTRGPILLRVSLYRFARRRRLEPSPPDRKSTRLNSSHDQISYAVFCLKKKAIPFVVKGAYKQTDEDNEFTHQLTAAFR